jgi:hypothetical protein
VLTCGKPSTSEPGSDCEGFLTASGEAWTVVKREPCGAIFRPNCNLSTPPLCPNVLTLWKANLQIQNQGPRHQGRRSPALRPHSHPTITPPSAARKLLKGCLHLFWTWIGFDALAEDFATHENAVRKANVLRFLLVVSLLTGVFAYLLRGCVDSSEIQSLSNNSRSNSVLESERFMEPCPVRTRQNIRSVRG